MLEMNFTYFNLFKKYILFKINPNSQGIYILN